VLGCVGAGAGVVSRPFSKGCSLQQAVALLVRDPLRFVFNNLQESEESRKSRKLFTIERKLGWRNGRTGVQEPST